MFGCQEELESRMHELHDEINSLKTENKELRRYRRLWRDLKHSLFEAKLGRITRCLTLQPTYGDLYDMMESIEKHRFEIRYVHHTIIGKVVEYIVVDTQTIVKDEYEERGRFYKEEDAKAFAKYLNER
jgi:poly-D-alanine transfer protein DltD